jgi:hypothetical protein
VASIFVLVACSSNSGGTTGPTGAAATTPKNVHWCSEKAATCEPRPIEICGACLATPNDLVRSTDTREYAGTGAPDVSCLDPATPPPPAGDSKTVKMKGFVKIFANGPDSRNVKVEVFEEEVEGGKPTGKLGRLVGTGASDEALGSKTESKRKNGLETTRTLFAYEVAGVPTEKPLVVKTSGATPEAGWFALYDWNVVARNSELAGEEWTFDVRALGNDDYASIIKAAYGRPPEAGQSAIAGEVHDCGDVRLSGATVGLPTTVRSSVFYMSEEEGDPLPDGNRRVTGKLGLYGVGALKPEVYPIAASGKVGGEVVALGSYKVSTFADSVSVYTFRGIRPWQTK